MHPIRFDSFLRPMVWGGQRLARVLDKPLTGSEPYGESWEVSDHPMHLSKVADGPLKGQTLRALLEKDPSAILGATPAKTPRFPWLIKFLDVSDWLSVQVHPSETAVKKLWPGEGSKTEAWFVLDAAPGSRVYAGLPTDVGESQLRAAVRKGTVADCMVSFEPKPGDFLFLPAGTVHAAGGGLLIAEVQQTSDATFRLFDWNRRDVEGKSRQLHVEESLACIDWKRGPAEPIHVQAFADSAHADKKHSQPLVQCPYFELSYLQQNEPFTVGGSGRLQCLLILRGTGSFTIGGKETAIAKGQVWLLPATMPTLPCRPSSGIAALLCTLPS